MQQPEISIHPLIGRLPYELTDSEEEALDNRSQYFVSKETLVIDGDEYTKTE